MTLEYGLIDGDPAPIIRNGKATWDFLELYDAVRYGTPKTVQAAQEFIRTAEILMPDGSEPVPARVAHVYRTEILRPDVLGEFVYSRWAYTVAQDKPHDKPRDLIPGLWPWGTIPLLAGQPKAGKTTLAIDLLTSLLDSERPFLGRFGPATLTADDFHDGITYINAETPAAQFEHAIHEAGLRDIHIPTLNPGGIYGGVILKIVHLEHQSGPNPFDLTDPDEFDRWATHLQQAESLLYYRSPKVIIVDGLTAILAAAGKGPEHYGLWYSKFRQLMRFIGTPNALVIGHSILSGGHVAGGLESQAGSDGLWMYETTTADSNSSRRKFSVRPRIGGYAIDPIVIERSESGQLIERVPRTSRKPSQSHEIAATRPDEGVDEELAADELKQRLIAYVKEHQVVTGQWPSARDLRDMPGDNAAIEQARDLLVANGELIKRKRSGRGGGFEFVPASKTTRPL